MNDLIREFLVWSVGFVVVSTMTLFVGHLLARRARKAQSAEATAGTDAGNAPKRRPAWGTALIVVIAYLFLLGPVLQGVSRTFRSGGDVGYRPTSAEASILPHGNRSAVGSAAVSRNAVRTKGASADCPCHSKQQDNVDVAADPNSSQKDSATIESRELVELK